MKFNVSLTGESDPTPQPQPDIVRTLIKWDNPIALRDGYGTPNRLVNGQQVGQFGFFSLHITDQDGNWIRSWSANANATHLTLAELEQIATLQIADASYTVKQKMGWLSASSAPDGWGSPLNIKDDNYRMISAVYAGQDVTLTGETMIRTIEVNGRTNQEKLWRVKAYPLAQWTRDNCQLVTAVSAANNYTEFTKGKIVLPTYFGDRKAYVLDRWLA